MDIKKFSLATLAGGAAYFLLGYLVWGILLSKFMAANMGSASGVEKLPIDFISLALGNLAGAALLTYIFMQWAGIKTFMTGAKAGAILGFLITLSYDLIMLGTTNISTLNSTIVDVLAGTAVTAIVGGVVGLVLGMSDKS